MDPQLKRLVAFSFAVLGLSSLISQVTLARELMIVFYGNEFFIGWLLFAWLFWVGAGAFLAGRLAPRIRNPAMPLIACHILVSMLFPATVALARYSRIAIGAAPGAIPDLLPSLACTFFGLAPVCLVLGAQFVAGAATGQSAQRTRAPGIVMGWSYLCETAGFVAGGVLFGYLLVLVNEFKVTAAVAWLNLFAGAAIYTRPPNRVFLVRPILIAASAIAAILFFAATPIHFATSAWRFPGQRLVATQNSIYGNLSVTRIGEQVNFFENGLFLSSDHQEMASEYLAHFALLYHPQPKRILLIGGGFSGVLSEMLKHDPDTIDYVELDPQILFTAPKYLSADLRRALDDHRVNVINTDGRFFVKRREIGPGDQRYDVVVVNLPDPSTELINRFYSREFLEEARAILAPGGVFATRLSFSPDYLAPELEDLGASIVQSLHTVFGHLVLLPENELFLIASPDLRLEYKPDVLIGRLATRRIEPRFLTPDYIRYRLTTDRIEQVSRALESNRTARENRDGRPIACYYSLVYWLSSFHAGAARVAAWAGNVRGSQAAAVLLVLVAAAALRARRCAGPHLAALAMGIASFSLMAFEVVIILSFQVFYGYLYYKLALIIGGLMLGMTAGTWAANEALERATTRTLATIHLCAMLYGLAFLVVFWFLASDLWHVSSVFQALFLTLAALAGALVGFEFPVANRLYLGPDDNSRGRTGTIYAVDLLGSCLGALLSGVWLVPVLGVEPTLILLVLLNAIIPIAAMRG